MSTLSSACRLQWMVMEIITVHLITMRIVRKTTISSAKQFMKKTHFKDVRQRLNQHADETIVKENLMDAQFLGPKIIREIFDPKLSLCKSSKFVFFLSPVHR